MSGKLTVLNAETTEQSDVGLQGVRTLRDDELDAVTGGSTLSSALSTAIKSVGDAVSTVAVKQ